MKVSLEELGSSRVRLNVEVDADKLEEGLKYAYRKIVKTVTVPGFRKGKTPRGVLERNYGKQVLFEDAIDHIFPEIYREAIEQTEVSPITEPSFHLDKIEPGEGLAFHVEVDVYPKIVLGTYKGIEVKKEEVVVTEEDVDKAIADLQLRHAELMAVDTRTDVQQGDFAVIDFKGYIDGEAFSGGASEDHTLEIGSQAFIPGFEEQLIGLHVGDEKDISVVFPQEYNNSELAGKEATFHVNIKSLKERVLPELDDDFAKDVGNKDTFAELRVEIRENIESNATDRIQTKLENELIDAIVANMELEIPKSMLEQQVAFLLRDFRMQLAYQGMTLEQYLEYTGNTEEEMKIQLEPEARKQIARNLTLVKVAENEGISPSEEEIDKRIEEQVAASARAEETRKELESKRDRVVTSLTIEKSMAFLVENAIISTAVAEPDTHAESNS